MTGCVGGLSNQFPQNSLSKLDRPPEWPESSNLEKRSEELLAMT